MEKVVFDIEEVQLEGLPQVCLCCGNDDPEELSSTDQVNGKHYSLGMLIIIAISLFIVPILWLIGFMWSLVAPLKTTLPFSVPLCKPCQNAHTHGRTTFGLSIAAFLVLASSVVYTDAEIWLFGWDLGRFFLVAALACILLIIDSNRCSKKFRPKLIKKGKKQITLGVYWDDYPGVYQYYRDYIALYGSDNKIGIEQET